MNGDLTHYGTTADNLIIGCIIDAELNALTF